MNPTVPNNNPDGPADTRPNSNGTQYVPPQQPVAPDTHYFHGQPYYDAGQMPAAATRPRRGKLVPVMTAVLAGVLLLGGGTYAYLASRRADPDVVFQNSLVNALSTRSFSLVSKAGDSSTTLKADVADIKKISLSSRETSDMLSFDLETRYTPDDGYVRLQEFAAIYDEPAAAAMKGKWVQFRSGGLTQESYADSLGLLTTYTPSRAVVSDYLIGNFAAADRQALLDIIRQENVYTYDAAKVTESTVDGQPVLRYDVKVRAAGLKKAEEKAFQVMGVGKQEYDVAARIGVYEDYTAVMYVATSSERLVKLEAKYGEVISTVSYSGFDSTTPDPKPDSAMRWDEFAKALDLSPGIGFPGSADEGLQDGPVSPDDERRTDINVLQSHIEAHYAIMGFYPTLAEINDASWRGQQLKGLDSSALQDPQGTSQALVAAPAAKAYSYRVGSGEGLAPCQPQSEQCSHFVLTATLSDGKTYSKQSY